MLFGREAFPFSVQYLAHPFTGVAYQVLFLLLDAGHADCMLEVCQVSCWNCHRQTLLFVHYRNTPTSIEKIVVLCKVLVKHDFWSWTPGVSTGQEMLFWTCGAGRLQTCTSHMALKEEYLRIGSLCSCSCLKLYLWNYPKWYPDVHEENRFLCLLPGDFWYYFMASGFKYLCRYNFSFQSWRLQCFDETKVPCSFTAGNTQ